VQTNAATFRNFYPLLQKQLLCHFERYLQLDQNIRHCCKVTERATLIRIG